MFIVLYEMVSLRIIFWRYEIMKTLVKVALGAVTFYGITELSCVDFIAIMWRRLMIAMKIWRQMHSITL